MNIEEYNLDSLRKLVRDLQAENRSLRELLNRNQIPYQQTDAFEEEGRNPDNFDPDQGGRIQPVYVTDQAANQFFSMFWGRKDVYAKRGRNGGYYPQCSNRWNLICPRKQGRKQICTDCPHHNWEELSLWRIRYHLLGNKPDGTDVLGIYPLFPDSSCRLLVFDFDNHEKNAEKTDFANTDNQWRDEVDALRLMCKKSGIDALTERSRSGRGAHVWIFFKEPIEAKTARIFGFMLLDKGASSVNVKSFRYYDRMYPSQDYAKSIGNLIALPLQGQALKNGNSAFIDEDWNAYPNQWEKLLHTRKLTKKQVEEYISKWTLEMSGQMTTIPTAGTERLKPWKRHDSLHQSDVTGVLHIILADGIYVDALNLSTRIQNQIRCMATFDNPVFYKNKRMGRSNYYHFSTIYLGKDIEGYIQIPRGLLSVLIQKCREAGIVYEVSNQRELGRPIRVRFNGELRMRQNLAAQDILQYDDGILSAATAFGKTVVCSYLIAERKVNTLILLESTDLISQWTEELNRFLVIDEEPPEYKTKTGRIKRRDSVIGTLKSGQDKTTGIIDVAMIGSVFKKGKFFDRLNSYGLILMDECHHAASSQAQQVLRRVNAKYLYGVSATPMRSDDLQKINYMLLGPVRHTYTAKERAQDQGISHIVIPRFTRTVDLSQKEMDIHKAYNLISEDKARNEMILEDIRECIHNKRTPVVLTRLKKHAKYLYDQLQGTADHVFLLYGDKSAKENEETKKAAKSVPDSETMILLATGQKIGEGFDLPRLDTLILAAPVAYGGRLAQYVGRVSRDYPGKKDVAVYDYVDSHIRIFDNQYNKRLSAYKKIGFSVVNKEDNEKQTAKAIYDAGNYMGVFERDIVEADHEVIISSPDLRLRKVDRFINLIKPRQEKGVKAIVITRDPEEARLGDSSALSNLIQEMQKAGIEVRLTSDDGQHYAVIDRKLVWHGGMNLLGREDAWDNLIRVTDVKAAEELLVMSEEDFL